MSQSWKCPHCNQPLQVSLEDGVHWVYCGYGPCSCNRMNDGETGATPEEALDNLLAQYEIWEEQQT